MTVSQAVKALKVNTGKGEWPLARAGHNRYEAFPFHSYPIAPPNGRVVRASEPATLSGIVYGLARIRAETPDVPHAQTGRVR